MAEPALRLITSDGESIPVEEAESRLAELLHGCEEDLSGVERDLRKERKKVKTLEAKLERDREDYVRRREVEEIFAEWQEIAGKGRSKLDDDRFDAIRKRLDDGYSRAQFTLAIEGAVFDPFVTVAKNGREVRHNDIELICRTAKKFEAAALKAPRSHNREGSNGDARPTVRGADGDEAGGQLSVA